MNFSKQNVLIVENYFNKNVTFRNGFIVIAIYFLILLF